MEVKLYDYPSLSKYIRKRLKMNQKDFGEWLGFSAVLIAQVETKKREPSKKLIKSLANKLGISSFSLMPFLDNEVVNNADDLSGFEYMLYQSGVTLQEKLINKKLDKILLQYNLNKVMEYDLGNDLKFHIGDRDILPIVVDGWEEQ